ncbi:hypothetical protein SEA_PHAYONCE_62 [Mycobacterium phage Phayonce]|uniref:Phage Gp37/Gp68 family protein n=1 Tax=Mycobacterium phage Phayonce TaxID=1647302 RepID=A0A0F6SJL4_9CAUD|nr:hypothetical protein SEA_PHAYONCE_62 [Mycobacterium phage Phayonce]AKF14422.1 hypothetical protein SEA_PHAYONCE_62 [Mycobacterium phage Phayonce]
MGDRTKIEWTRSDDGSPGATWNPVTGCTKVSTGCDNCYAEKIANRFAGTKAYPNGFEVTSRPERLDQPLRWKRPRRIFVNSMADLFHDQVPDDYIARVFAVMALSDRHTFQVLTKRHGRMRALLRDGEFQQLVYEAWGTLDTPKGQPTMEDWPWPGWPLPNVWLGVSTENQQWADIRIPALLDTPAAVRFSSAEPLLGPIEMDSYLVDLPEDEDGAPYPGHLDWVIVGGESGPGARPMHPDWARSLRDQCQAAGVPFLFKQRGEWTWNEPGEFRMPTKPYSDRIAVMHGAGMTAMTKSNPFNPFERGHPHWTTRIDRVGKKRAGRELDGRTWDQYPDV